MFGEIASFFETAKGLHWVYKLLQKLPFIDVTTKVLNPDISVLEDTNRYKQVGAFEYEHTHIVKFKTKKRGLCLYVLRYSWDGSEKDYLVKVFEEKDDKREELAVAEKLPNVEEQGVKTFVAVFESDKKKEIKTFVVVISNLSDLKNVSGKDTYHKVIGGECKRVTMEVSLLSKKRFFKRVVDTNGDSPRQRIDRAFSSDLKKSCSWCVHDDKDVGGIKKGEKYYLYWK